MTNDNSNDIVAPGEHTRELMRVDEGERVTLITHDGDEIEATCTGQDTMHTEGVHITQQNSAYFRRESDGERLIAVITDGLRGSPDGPEFPLSTPLSELDNLPDGPDEDVSDSVYLGYVAEVRREVSDS